MLDDDMGQGELALTESDTALRNTLLNISQPDQSDRISLESTNPRASKRHAEGPHSPSFHTGLMAT